MGFLSGLFSQSSLNGHEIERGIIEFVAENVQCEELIQCKIGDYVNLWSPKDSREVYGFRRGSVGGTGRIGLVPNKYSRIISAHLSKGLKCETEIIDIKAQKSLCKIKCRMISQAETNAKMALQIADSAERLKIELQKPYTPKNSLSVRIQLPKDHNLREGQELYLEKRPLEHYVQNASRLHIKFVDKNGVTVAEKANEPRLITSILRALFSQIDMKILISSIETPDEHVLKYVEYIEAKANVSFRESGRVG